MPTERPPLLGEVVPTFADRGCCVVSATDPPVVFSVFLTGATTTTTTTTTIILTGKFIPLSFQLLLKRLV
jgi:hypothetical protein